MVVISGTSNGEYLGPSRAGQLDCREAHSSRVRIDQDTRTCSEACNLKDKVRRNKAGRQAGKCGSIDIVRRPCHQGGRGNCHRRDTPARHRHHPVADRNALNVTGTFNYPAMHTDSARPALG